MRLTALLAALALLASGPVTASERLVVAGGAITEVIYALGAEDHLVAVDTTSNYPPEARELPRIGYVRALPVEGILALDPDRLLVTPEAGPERALSRLARRIPVTRVDAAWTPESVICRVRTVAAIVDRYQDGEALAAELEREFAAIREQLPLEEPPRVLFLLATGGQDLMIGGTGTQVQALLDALMLPNVAENTEGFKPLNAEAALALRPELIVVAETVADGFRLADWPALQQTPAGRNGRILVRDSMFLLGFGPRLPQAMAEVLRAAAGSVESTAWTTR